jgi:hypothetical protein
MDEVKLLPRPYVLGPISDCDDLSEDGGQLWQAEVQTMGGYGVVATIYAGTEETARTMAEQAIECWSRPTTVVTGEHQSVGVPPQAGSGCQPSASAASSTASSQGGIPNAAHWGDGRTPCHVEDGFDWACQQEAEERHDEAELYQEAERAETKCALGLFRALAKDFGQYRAVKVDGPLNWTITNPRTEAALLAALETTDPPAALDAAQPIIDRLNRWESFQTNRYGWSPPDGKRIEIRVGDLRQLRAAAQPEVT